MNENNHGVAVKSNESDCSYAQSDETSFVNDVDSILSPGEVDTPVKLQHFHNILFPRNILTELKLNHKTYSI